MIQHIMFDFDGTLADTSEGIINSMHYAFDKLGVPRIKDSEIADSIGPPLEEMLKKLLRTDNQEYIRNGITFFRERYGIQGLKELKLYPDVYHTLLQLQSKGKSLYIVTSKPEVFVKQICEKFGILSFFTDITGVFVNESSMSKGKRMQLLMEKHEIDPTSAIMVGDRPEDAEAAAVNHVACIGMTYGFGREAELNMAGCTSLSDSITQLIGLIA